jgi:hypothetical protein
MLRARVPRIATIGLSPINGVSSGDFPLSGSATGVVVINGVASGDFPLSGSATGVVVINSVSSGDFPLSGNAVGSVVINGVASGDFPLSGLATGAIGLPPINGVASGDFPLSGLATGTVTGEGNALTPNGGARREYQPYYYELQNRRKIERKFEEAELDLKATENKIEALELKRTRDLADESMQEELLALLTRQNELIRIINDLQQQKLMVMRDDEDFIAILMYLN